MEAKRYAEIKAACDAAFSDFGSPSSQDDAQIALSGLEQVMRDIHETAFFAGVDYESKRQSAKPVPKPKPRPASLRRAYVDAFKATIPKPKRKVKR